ncbi:MAG: GtrA family protein [Candidatus Thiodiazotropha endolucinida]
MSTFNVNGTDYTIKPISELVRALPLFLQNEFFKYLIASGVALVIDVGSLYVLTEFFGFHYLTSATLSFSLGLLSIYLLSITWVFSKRRFSEQRIELFIFVLIGVIGLLINAFGMYLFTSMIGVYYLYSKALTTLVVFSWNFGARKIALFT